MSDRGKQVLRGFVARVWGASWFAAVGEAMAEAERAEAGAYLAGLGFGDAEVAPVGGWKQAERVIRAEHWDARWWQAEEERRARLLPAAQASRDGAELLAALSEIAVSASDRAHGAAAVAAAGAGVADPGLIRAAAGSAATACYQAALEAACGAEGPFSIKLRLFEAGRWPLCLEGSRYFVF
jgi:hypothetical protein